MFGISFIILATVLTLSLVTSLHGPLNYEFSIPLHANYLLHWNSPNNNKICMAVQVGTLGWVGLGFSPNGGMTGSDIMMAWVVDGEVTISDRYAKQQILPELDGRQDFQLIEGYEENGETIIQFCRILNTCDEKDREIVSGTTKVIYSWNDDDPDPTPSQHSTRGTKSVNLVGSQRLFNNVLPANAKEIRLNIGNFTIPHNTDTTYWCRSFRINQPATKHHIIRIGVDLDPRGRDLVDHIVVYRCVGSYSEFSGRCYDQSGVVHTSGAFADCYNAIISVWAVGGNDIEMPLEAGLPLGPQETFDTVILEVHYNNPGLQAGVVDDSGFRWYYTETLRSHDIGIILLGNSFTTGLRVPPQTESFLVQGYCPNNCTNLFPHQINVVASMLHSHLTGVAMWTQIIRDKKEIGYLDMNLHYDFDFQDTLYHENPYIIKPGDELILNCLYNTKSRNEFTLGGLTAQQEMCYNFLYYYPRLDITVCSSFYKEATAFQSALDSFRCNNVDVNGSSTYSDLSGKARNIEWTEKIARTLEISQMVDTNGQNVFCGQLFGVNIPKPGVDYEVFPYRYDTCGNYNGTYYPGGDTADYYYDCNMNQSYFHPIGPTDSALRSFIAIPTLIWFLVASTLTIM